MSDCIFCKIISGNAPADILYQDDDVMVIKDIKLVSQHHFLAIPKYHIPNINSVSSEHKNLVEKLVHTGKQVLMEHNGDVQDVRLGFHVPPFNSVSHLHLHVIAPASTMSFIDSIIYKPGTMWFSSVGLAPALLKYGAQIAIY